MTFNSKSEYKSKLPIPDFKDECQYYYNIEKEEEFKNIIHHMYNKPKELVGMIFEN